MQCLAFQDQHIVYYQQKGSRKKQKKIANDPINGEGDFQLKHTEYFRAKEFCQKVLKLIQDLLVGSEDAVRF